MSSRAIATLLVLLVSASCQAPPRAVVERPPSLDSVPLESWQALASSTVFFGHQSVGSGVVAGVREIVAARPEIRLEVRETRQAVELRPGMLAHAKLGRNFSYRSKLDAFAGAMAEGLGDRVDMALLKLCFVDVLAETDVVRLFTDYAEVMAELERRYPRTTFVYVTDPLTWHLSGLGALDRAARDLVKGLLGRPEYGRFYDNRNRNRLNRMIRSSYGASDRLFDIAAVQSTHPDGRRATFTRDGTTYYAMVADYTDDGGHLNAAGRRHVSEQLLIFLAEAAAAAGSAGGVG